MKDPRMVTLAHNLVNYCCSVQPGERVLIENTGLQKEFVAELVKEVYAAGGIPFVNLKDPVVDRAMLMGCTQEQLELMAKYDALRMQDCQAYIGLRAGDNSYENTGVPSEKLSLYMKHYSQAVHGKIRVPNTKWVVLRYPTPSMAQQAGMSTEAFEEHYFNVCNLDYGKMSRAMDALVERMERTDKVRIVGPGTDLTFSIKGMPAIKCDGKLNIPDGEVFSAPIKDSVNGVLQYNTPSFYNGSTFENVRLVFKDGKIIEATANDNVRLNAIFDTDEGARYVGESEKMPCYVRPEFSMEGLYPADYVLYAQAEDVVLQGGTVLAYQKKPYFNRTPEHFCSHGHTPNAPEIAGPGMTEGAAGIYIGWQIFREYACQGSLIAKRMVQYALDRLLGEKKTLTTNLGAQGVVTLMEQDGRYVNHMLYAVPVKRGEGVEVIEDIVPVYGVEVMLRLPRKIRRVYLAPQEKALPFCQEGDAVRFTVEKLECHQMVALEYEK